MSSSKNGMKKMIKGREVKEPVHFFFYYTLSQGKCRGVKTGS